MRVFQETQRFDQWWLKLLYVGLLGFVIFCLYNWFVLQENVGNVNENNAIGQLVTVSSALLPIALMYSFKLRTSIDEVGVHYQFLPIQFSKKTVRWAEMEKCYVRTYSPLREYGGWGYRISFGKGKALNVKGSQGIQIVFKNGKKLLLGSQKKEDAAQVIQRYFKPRS